MEKNKYIETFELFSPTLSQEAITLKVGEIVQKNYDKAYSKETLSFLYSTIDLTSLSATDTEKSIKTMVESVNKHAKENNAQPNVAAVCVYPAQISTVKKHLKVESVHIAAVSGGFPASQTFEEIKYAETALSVASGANEIDIVLNLNHFLSEDYSSAVLEIEEQKASCRGALLKVILETGALKEPEAIRRASILSLFSGADFIKTSTGKEFPGATLEAVYVMCCVLKEYHKRYNRRIGIKVSGGVRTAEDAVKYYCIISEILGKEWLTPQLFRIGASSLMDNLKKAIEEIQ